jgi:hypothetical protein
MSSIRSISAEGPIRLVFVVHGRGSLNLRSHPSPGSQRVTLVACEAVAIRFVNGSLMDRARQILP